MDSSETLIELFRQYGLKITPQRRVILELLSDDHSHPTVDEVYQRVLKAMPDVSRTTVYNTIRELVALGALTEVQELSAGGLRYDTNAGPHHHLFCTQCHTLLDIDQNFPGVALAPEETAGYEIIRHQVTFYGTCPNCQQQGGNN